MTEAEFIADMNAELERMLLTPVPVKYNPAAWKLLGDAWNAELVKNGYAVADWEGNLTITPKGQAWVDCAISWGLGIDDAPLVRAD